MLERQEADIQTKVEKLEELNQSLRERDKIKDDAISQLSDQLMALTTTRMLKQRVRSLTNGIKYEAKTSFLQEIVIKKNLL